MRIPVLFAALTLVVAACSPAPEAEPAATTPPAPAPAAPVEPTYTFGPELSAEDFAQHVKTLASDEFEGRAPGGRGEELTVEYLKAQFQRLGLQPGNGDSYFQSVPMVETTADINTALEIKTQAGPQSYGFGDAMVIGTRTGEQEVAVRDSEMVFVGYGVVAPEADWNDYAGVDVKGKTVVMLVNDPGFHSADETLFGGKRMTYYGRWTYKFEEAARQGAVAALIIHDTEGAGYGWEVVKNSWRGAQFELPAADDPEPRLPLQGWISGDTAKALFAGAKLDLDALRAAAGKRGFKAVPMQTQLSTQLHNTIRHAQSRNVMARLPGRERPDETIIYMGHWDHLGKHEGEATAPDQDVIYNGAIDNASGVAGVLEIAEEFVTQDPPPARSLMFIAVTLEESGLLGSKYYVAHPTVPLDQTVAVINLDALTIVGKTRDLVVTGYGSSELEDRLKTVADAQGRVLHAEEAVEKGFYYRSDHFNFAKAGVPALYVKSGLDHTEKGVDHAKAIVADYDARRYHKPDDEYDPAWDLAGVIQDLYALYEVGRDLAADDAWPNWYAGNEFRAKRDAMMAAKAQQAKR